MATFTEIKNQVEEKIKNIKSFKIGKTGQQMKDRFDNKYKDEYSNYEELGWSNERNVIDNAEEFLIKEFINNMKCKNEQIGSGEMKESKKYIIYIVWN
ncbi:hypothetical protein [Draconibacterium halophilum]|uniref:Uncharacterized protein n=1 Tax=Draconibacterium halophilum TaxID=2706887 RepID=A0A6C0REI6_9BACT|nr:hypothetical protein [Draconibacterium halophilum]QIA08800.1 hypothetical protein G0Q07_14205 [Draconibacterium halophilum]